ncbi:MAG: uL30 family ribosomal protein [Staphylococcus epidermidis]|nr:uL30 family ribosomal protein [Staphylococcus epidermidis]
MAKLQITLTRSVIGRPETQRKTVEAFAIRGQINKVKHLLTIEEK